MLLDEVEQQLNLQLLERQQLSRACSSYSLEGGCSKMLKIYGKIVPRWVIRSCAQAAVSPRTELGLPLPSTQSATVTTSSDPARRKQWGQGGAWSSLLTTLHTPSTRQTQDKPCNWRNNPHQPVQLVLFWENTSGHRESNRIELEGWPSPGRHCALLLLSIPLSSTCLGVALPPAPPADFLPPQWRRHRCRADARHILG